jgi:hypothetical protein
VKSRRELTANSQAKRWRDWHNDLRWAGLDSFEGDVGNQTGEIEQKGTTATKVKKVESSRRLHGLILRSLLPLLPSVQVVCAMHLELRFGPGEDDCHAISIGCVCRRVVFVVLRACSNSR